MALFLGIDMYTKPIDTALRPNMPKRVKINVHLLETELQEFKQIARQNGLGFSALVRAALRKLKADLSKEVLP